MKDTGETRIIVSALKCLGGTLIVLGSATQVAQAQDNWEWRVAPYLWATSLQGRVATVPGVPPADVDASFSDILDNLDFAGMVVGHGRNGRWGITGDLQYVKLTAESGSLAPTFGKAVVKIENTIVSLMADYELAQAPNYEVWVSGGLRYWRVKNDITLTPGTAPGRTANGADSWVDPIIGVRGRREIGERSFVTGWAYVGGFGAGSENMADVFGGVGYQFTPTTAGVLGYRWMTVDRQNGSFLYDATQQGVLAGLSFQF